MTIVYALYHYFKDAGLECKTSWKKARRFTPDDQRDHELKGIAEIDLAKHRNAETGMFKLALIGGYTKFENLADEDLLAG